MQRSNHLLLFLGLVLLSTLSHSVATETQKATPLFDYTSLLSQDAQGSESSSVPDNYCLKQENDPSDYDFFALSDKEKLLRFVDGPCSPVILVPGVLATKMQVELDCDTFKKAHPSAFEACGWNTCKEPSWYELWKRKPKKTYNLWIPDIFSPMSVIANELHPKCFREFFTLNYDPEQVDYSDRYAMRDGLLLRYYNQNSEHPNGGLDAIGDLDPKPKQPYMSDDLLYWEHTRRKLNKMGYQDGLTLFGSPYDWRRSPIANESRFTLKRTLEFLKKTTGKSTVVFAHSMGNMQMLYNANQMSQEDKDRLIRHYAAVMPPFAGSTKAALFLMGGSNVDPYGLGIPLETIRSVDSMSSSLYDLYPKPSYDLLQNEPFFDHLMQRVQAEKEHGDDDPEFWAENKAKLPYSWMPSPAETCSNDNLVNRQSNGCSIGVKNMAEETVLRVQDREYKGTEEARDEFMSRQEGPFVSKKYWKEIMDEVKADGLDSLTNPGVETTLIYNASLQTMYGLEYDYNPAEMVHKGEWADPDKQLYEMGDGTVNISTALLGPLKWAWEFDQQVKSGKSGPAKGVKLVEYCSTYGSNMEFDYSKPGYEGLYCKCLDFEQDGHDCNHVFSLNDDYLVEYLAHLASSLKNPSEGKSIPQICPKGHRLKDLTTLYISYCFRSERS